MPKAMRDYPTVADVSNALGETNLSADLSATLANALLTAINRWEENVDPGHLSDPLGQCPEGGFTAIILYTANLYGALTGASGAVTVGNTTTAFADLNPVLADLEATYFCYPDPFPTSTT